MIRFLLQSNKHVQTYKSSFQEYQEIHSPEIHSRSLSQILMESHDRSLLLVGVRLRPTDPQLLQYLHWKIHGQPYFKGAILDCDLYGEMEPWEIWSRLHSNKRKSHIKKKKNAEVPFIVKIMNSYLHPWSHQT